MSKKDKASTVRHSKTRVGDRYFKVDPGYDKRVYENSIWNWIRIILTFVVYYIIMGFFWATCLLFGIYNANLATWVCIIIFIVAVILILSLTFFGYFSTKAKARAERINLEISEKRKKEKEEADKRKKREEAMAIARAAGKT